jgi:hypothetical protein
MYFVLCRKQFKRTAPVALASSLSKSSIGQAVVTDKNRALNKDAPILLFNVSLLNFVRQKMSENVLPENVLPENVLPENVLPEKEIRPTDT